MIKRPRVIPPGWKERNAPKREKWGHQGAKNRAQVKRARAKDYPPKKAQVKPLQEFQENVKKPQPKEEKALGEETLEGAQRNCIIPGRSPSEGNRRQISGPKKSPLIPKGNPRKVPQKVKPERGNKSNPGPPL